MSKSNQTWNPTRYQFLYRHANGVYYARLTVNKRRTWRSLKTENLGVARAELNTLLEEEQKRTELASPSTKSGTCTLEQMAEERLEIALCDTSTKSSTKKFEQEVHAALFRFKPDFGKLEISKVIEKDCREWAIKHREHFSAGRFNWALSVMKQIFELAIEQGFRMTNPAKKLKRAKIMQKDLGMILPEPKLFAEWIKEIRTCNNRWNNRCGDWVEFQAYTGLRPDTESPFVTWKHVDFETNELVVIGDLKNEGTKNRSTRRIPMSDNLRELLQRMRSERPKEGMDIPVLQIKGARKAMKRAAAAVGMEDITPYDLRHLFATRCLESGVDAATVANWLGHKDKGALVLKVYNHVRDAHSHDAAKKVSF